METREKGKRSLLGRLRVFPGRTSRSTKVETGKANPTNMIERPHPQQPLLPEVEELAALLKRKEDLKKMLLQECNRLDCLKRSPRPVSSVIGSVEALIHTLECALEELEQTIRDHVKQSTQLHEQQQHLLTVPGIGDKSVLPILVFLHRWEARTSGAGTAKGLTAFAGLDPVVHRSGTSIHKRPSISKMGDADIRCLLFLCAVGGRRAKDSPLTRFYQKLMNRRKHMMVALIATARKILVWAFAVFRYHQPFDPALALPRID